MRRGIRDVLLLGALATMVGACTIEDAKDTRRADSLAALTSKPGPVATSAATTPAVGAAQATVNSTSQSAPMQTAGGAATAAVDSTGGSANASAGSAGAMAGTSTTGSLSPDSVDAGRRDKSKLLPLSRMRLEVDLAAKQLTAFDGDQQIATYRVAIGSAQWPTQTGQWEVKQVVWNPEWIPPKEEAWAEDKNPKQPGAPDNPLGRAQLVYDPPRTVHGTNEPASIGKAVSHGSIRMANADIVQLARRVMEMAGAPKDASFYQHAQKNRTEKIVVDLPQRVQIRVF
jgi:lipoprotein-anchoring transpeptidase ErfK/SrfK